MLDIKFIQANVDKIRHAARIKHIEIDIDKLLAVYEELKQAKTRAEDLAAAINKASKEIPALQGDAKQARIAEMKATSAQQAQWKEKQRVLDEQFEQLMLYVPNVPSDDTPEGKDDTQNVQINTWGTPRKFDFQFKDHITLGEELDIIDVPRGVKIAGTRNYVLKNEAALLEIAILQFSMEKLIKRGFQPFLVPVLAKREAMTGTAYLPGGEDQAYYMEKDELFLVGTSEVSLCSYHLDEILDESELPKLYAGWSPCFRREAGAAGKDTRGLYRIHQFQKIEQVVVCKADWAESEKWHQALLQNSEDILQALELPYRVVRVCGGDLGRPQVKKYDVETWMPSRNNYGETHSCSMMGDFQARRLKLRYRDKETKNTVICHTLNNTAVASPRILIPILENYQNADGTVTVPKVLRPYMMGIDRIEPKKKR